MPYNERNYNYILTINLKLVDGNNHLGLLGYIVGPSSDWRLGTGGI